MSLREIASFVWHFILSPQFHTHTLTHARTHTHSPSPFIMHPHIYSPFICLDLYPSSIMQPSLTHLHTHALAQTRALAHTHTHTHTQIFHLAYVLQLPVPPSVGFIPFASTFTPFKISFYLNFRLSFANMQYVKVISSNFIAHLKLHEFFLLSPSHFLSYSIFLSFHPFIQPFFKEPGKMTTMTQNVMLRKKFLRLICLNFPLSLALSLSVTHTRTRAH